VNEKYSFRTIYKEVLRYKKQIIIANVIALIATIISTPAPLLMPLLVDEVLLGKRGFLVESIDGLFGGVSQQPYFYVLVVLFVTLILRMLFFVLNVLQNKIFTIISKNVTFKIRKQMLKHLSKTALSEFEFFGSGKILSMMVVDIDTIDHFLGSVISRLIISVLTVLGVGIVLFLIHWQLALFIFTLNPFVVFLTTKFARRVSKLKKEENSRYAVFQEVLGETLELFRQVRASNQEKRFISIIAKRAQEVKDASISFGYKSDAAARFSFLIFLSGFEVFRAASILVVAYSDLTVGLMLAIFGYLWVMMSPIQEILNIQYAYHNAKAALKRINEIFALAKEPNFSHLKNPFKDSFSNAVELRDICFSYDNRTNILKNINLHIKKGQKAAFVGSSGSGKSTLAQIIVGFYPVRSGEVLFDGVSVKEIGLDVVRENVFLVLQNPILFNDTIRMNITLGKEVEDKKIQKALKIAQLERFVNELEDGLDTKVGKNGVKLSGGQRQRLSIARMILQEPNVVILDEATSALDVYTEESLFEALKEFLKERTTIIIAHRLSTIRDADYIYVMEGGRIIEEGTYKELIKKDGLFLEFAKRS
jgi:ATP-binding cassette subfamily C protein